MNRSKTSAADEPSRSALVIAHPGHELRVYGWLEAARPFMFVLTDGSGGSGVPRLDTTHALCEASGASPAACFGRFTDLEIYGLLLDGRFTALVDMVDELADEFGRLQIDTVAGDAAEGYNPGHDVCRLLIDAAVELSNRRGAGRRVANYEFALDPANLAEPAADRRMLRLKLDDSTFERKLERARGYEALRPEVETALRLAGIDAFRQELLVESTGGFESCPGRAPFYERHGAAQVRSGKYDRVIRHHEHIIPLERALREHLAGCVA